jgi:hypothetical protein
MSQPVTFDIEGAVYNVQCDAKELFECPCHRHQDGSNKKYQTRKDLLDHILLIQTDSSHNLNFLGRHLLETPIFAQYRLAVNTKQNLLLCLSCDVVAAVIPSQLKSHLLKQHEVKLEEADRRAIIKVLALCTVDLSTLPGLHYSIIPEIEGLPVFEGHPCPLCLVVGGNYKALKGHMCQHHNGVGYPLETNVTFYQQLKQGSHNQTIHIHIPEDVPAQFTIKDILVQAASMMKDPSSSMPPPAAEASEDPHSYCPWLRQIRWQDLTTGKDVAELIALVGRPKR